MNKFYMIKYIRIFWLLFILMLHQSVQSQPSITWQKIYASTGPGTGLDGCHGICEADSGNFFLAGFTLVPSIGNKIWVIKINPYGVTIWTKIIGNAGSRANSVVSSRDGGCVVTGDAGQAFAIKIDRNGNIVWERYYGGSGVQLKKIKKTSDSGYIACGRINLQDGYVLKINSSGFFQWQKVYPSNELLYLHDVEEDNNSGFVLCGYELAHIQDTAKAVILKIDSSGELVWQKKYKFSEQTAAYSIKIIDNMYLVGGATGTVSVTIGKVYFCKIDSNGNIIFTKIFGTTRDEYFSDMELINENKYVIAMSRDSGSSLYGKAIVTNSIGDIIAERFFATSSFIIFESILSISNGDLMFAGNADFQIPGVEQVGYAVRTDSTLFFKTVNIENNNIIENENFNLYQNYPNPFNPSTEIIFELKRRVKFEFKLIDISGRRIINLIDEERNKGLYKYSLNANQLDLASGIYFIELSTSFGNRKTIKILYLK